MTHMSTGLSISMTFVRAIGLALLLSVACGKETAVRSPSAGASPSRVVSPKPAQAVATLTDADADTAGCGLIPKHQFDAPMALVREWVRRDSLGKFMSPDDQLFELMACPGHLGGGDEVVVSVDPTIRTNPGDSVDYFITYRRLGRVHVDSTGKRTVFVSDPGIDTIVVNVVPTPFGWRLPVDVANPHLSPRVTLQAWQGDWVPTSRDSLARLAAALER